MDAIYKINAVAAKNQQIVDAYESYISKNMGSSDTMNEFESQFNSQIAQFKETVNENVDDIADIVRSKYPRPQEPNYSNKRQYYDILSQHACNQIDQMDKSFDNAFSRLKNLFHRLSTWIRNKVTQVFTAVKSFFRGVKSLIKR